MYEEYPKSRREAKAQGAKFYFTGEPCIKGHVALRLVKGTCLECRKLEYQLYPRKEYLKEWNKRESSKEIKRKYYEAHKEEVKARAKARPIADQQQYRRKWKQEHPEKVLESHAQYKRRHRESRPVWLTAQDVQTIKELYGVARELTVKTGIKYVVDHIIPLRNDTVCGLHVPWNLKVIRHAENTAKGGKFESY